MTMLRISWGALLLLSLCLTPQNASADDVYWVAEDSGNYNLPSNWDINFVPVLTAQYQDIAIIDNGGTAVLSNTPSAVAGVHLLGGTLQILRGGNLQAGDDHGATGHLLQSAAGTLTIGEPTGADPATFGVAGNATLSGTTNVIGPNVNFSAANLELSGQLVSTVTAGGHSALQTSGTATVGGTLQLEFDGVAPTLGTSWTIVDAASITGSGFSQISTSAPLGRGGYLVTEQVAGGNGTLLQASIAQGLVLTVHRRTGELRIENASADMPVEFDGYLITSLDGALLPDDWNSLVDQGQTQFTESNPNASHLGELSQLGSHSLAAGAELSLGHAFQAGTLVGGSTSTLGFSYHDAGGVTRTPDVEFVGPTDEVALLIGADGRAYLQNQSASDLSVNGYLITSLSGSLDAGGWTSLASGDAEWTESNPSELHLGELTLHSQLDLEAEGEAIDLGILLDTEGTQDLRFEYYVPGVGTQEGVVVYNASPFTFLAGDYDYDEDVDADDYLVWKATFGSTTNLAADGNGDEIVDAADYTIWRNNLGATPPAALSLATTQVPEPSSAFLLMGTIAAGMGIARRAYRS